MNPDSPTGKQYETFLALIRRAREAESLEALRFIMVNDSHLLAPYRQSALWSRKSGVECLSGLIQVEANTPYVQWLKSVFDFLAEQPARCVSKAEFPEAISESWSEWFPEYALWVPFRSGEQSGGVLFGRSMPWSDTERYLFEEWGGVWESVEKLHRKNGAGDTLARSIGRLSKSVRRLPVLWAVLLLVVSFIPIRLSVLAPGELVPSNPLVVRAPFDGILKDFRIGTNDSIEIGDALFAYDASMLESRVDVVQAELFTAKTEYRQASQWALQDHKARGALPAARGKVEEKKLELDYLQDRLERNTVMAEYGGIAFVEDPTGWIGRPVVAGQQIMRIADPREMEIEAWLSVGDAIALKEGDLARLYLSSSPFDPVRGRVRLISHESVLRPHGAYAYRVRIKIEEETAHRVGLKGTVRLSSGRVPFVYWVLRRPLAALRGFFGW